MSTSPSSRATRPNSSNTDDITRFTTKIPKLRKQLATMGLLRENLTPRTDFAMKKLGYVLDDVCPKNDNDFRNLPGTTERTVEEFFVLKNTIENVKKVNYLCCFFVFFGGVWLSKMKKWIFFL